MPIRCIKELKITQGVSAGLYAPDDFVTRGQMAAFIARTWEALGQTCSTEPHDFADVTGGFAEMPVRGIKALNITQGTRSDTYSPSDPVTRAKLAASSPAPTKRRHSSRLGHLLSGASGDEALDGDVGGGQRPASQIGHRWRGFRSPARSLQGVVGSLQP
jgi:hypothetical protein